MYPKFPSLTPSHPFILGLSKQLTSSSTLIQNQTNPPNKIIQTNPPNTNQINSSITNPNVPLTLHHLVASYQTSQPFITLSTTSQTSQSQVSQGLNTSNPPSITQPLTITKKPPQQTPQQPPQKPLNTPSHTTYQNPPQNKNMENQHSITLQPTQQEYLKVLQQA